MTIAVYPGSFNPWHAGHKDVLNQAIKTFDKVIVAIGRNPEKESLIELANRAKKIEQSIAELPLGLKIEIVSFSGLFRDFIQDGDYNVIIKGIRNIQDFEYEKNQQYWNEDLGIKIPTFYVIADRKLAHVSSSALRSIKKITGEKNG